MKSPLVHLPLLEPRQDALEKCVYCPKLCRATCPVSNAEPHETLIPWGKMSTSFFMARGDVPIAPEEASVAWACTDCGACTERCDHKNPVGATLTDARADLFERGAAPAGAKDLAASWSAKSEARRAAVAALNASTQGTPAARLLLGCSYLRRSTREAELAKRVTEALVGGPVAVASGCCGLPLLAAGDRGAYAREQAALASDLSGDAPVIVADPGCFRTIQAALPSATLLVDRAAASIDRFQHKPGLPVPRYHDPCQLGRGLGRYDAPRAIIERVVGERPHEFERARERADCAGSGSILPLTRPEGSAQIAKDRIAEHTRLGDGKEVPIATACGSSLHRFRSSGSRTLDLLEYMAIGLGV
ncbi:MAG: (Fe-S)-binding protein [Polyangiaceae bacterium]|nr:(Fe-S)-binding protein [Polyangiaceae bacterium]